MASLGGMATEIANNFKSIELANADHIVVSYSDNYSKEECNKPDRRNQLESAIKQISGKNVKLEIRVDEAELAKSQSKKPQMSRIQVLRQLEQHPMVKKRPTS